jgi:hypothetical protein
MKRLSLVLPFPCLALGLILETTPARADGGSFVKGTIKVSAVSSVNKCDALEVVVSSKEQTPPPAGYTGLWFGQPKWTRHATATGTWSSGSCTYTVKVVSNSEFNVVVSSPAECDGWYAATTVPPQAGPFKVAKGDTKEQNFTLSSLVCIPPPK